MGQTNTRTVGFYQYFKAEQLAEHRMSLERNWICPNISNSGKSTDLSSCLQVLLAIEAALAQLLYSVSCGAIGPNMTVFSDSQGALRALASPSRKSGQFFIRSICQQKRQINASGRTSVSFQWSPGDPEIPGNKRAHCLAKLASKPNLAICPYQRICPLLVVTALEKGLASHRAKPDSLTRSSNGRFIKSFDKALRGPHTLALYKGKTKSQANTLCQLWTGISRLNSYLFKIRAADSEEYPCGRGKEKIDHLLFKCGRWSILREEHKIKRLAKGRWSDTAYLLGGWSGERKDGALESWKPNLKMVNATIKFVEATERLNNNRWRHRQEDEEEINGGEERSDEGEESHSEGERPLQRGGGEMGHRR